MALQDGFPSASGLADANDVRLALAGLIVRDSSGNPRTGVFFRHANALVTSTATMNSSVAGFEAAVSRSGQGVILLPNNGATNVLHDTAPVANSRYDTIYVKQNDAVSPNADANNLPVFGILKGTPSVSPTLPTWASAKTALDAAPGIGTGAEPLTAVLIPSTATSMQSAGVVYTQLYQYTTASGGVVPFRTKTEMDLWTTAPQGQRARVLISGVEYQYFGLYNASTNLGGAGVAGWYPAVGAVFGAAVRSANGYNIPTTETNVSDNANFVVESAVGLSYSNGWVIPATGIYEVTAFWRGGGAIDAYIGFGVGGTADAAWIVGNYYGNRLTIFKKFTAGSTVKMFARASTLTGWDALPPNGGFGIKWVGVSQ